MALGFNSNLFNTSARSSAETAGSLACGGAETAGSVASGDCGGSFSSSDGGFVC